MIRNGALNANRAENCLVTTSNNFHNGMELAVMDCIDAIYAGPLDARELFILETNLELSLFRNRNFCIESGGGCSKTNAKIQLYDCNVARQYNNNKWIIDGTGKIRYFHNED